MPASLFDAYIAGGAQAFLAESFRTASDRRHAVVRAAARPISPRVLAALGAQNARFGASKARSERLAALARGAAVVVTGQQVGLFLGPLYTVYKAASAIRVAHALASETGVPVVPVFWLQTEDHDLPEIASCTVLRPDDEPLRLALHAAADNRISIAHLTLPPEVDACLNALRRALGQLPHASPHLERLARHYRAGAAWGDAFAGVLAELFEPEGLLVIDPRDPALASEAAAVHHHALVRADDIAHALTARCAQLERAGFSPTVHVRRSAPLSFFHATGAAAPRHRLAASPEGFVELGTDRAHTRIQLLTIAERDPRCFSTSALLRPILQDTWLPTAAYVGGPAEVAYFAQLPPLYDAFELPMPLIVPRARFCVLEAETIRLLERLGLDAADAARDAHALLVRLAQSGAEQTPSPDQLERTLVDGFERVLSAALAELAPYDAQLAGPATKTRDKLRLTAAKLRERYASARAHGDPARRDDLVHLRRQLQPGGVPQERVYGFSYFAARYGERAFLEAVLAAIDPFDPTPRELRP